LNTLAAQGAPVHAIESVRTALHAFSRVIDEHASGRDDFNLMLDSMGLAAPERQLEASRELAFRGNSGICGLQARTRLTTNILVPSKSGDGLADVAMVGGFVGLRRLRSRVRWPLFRFQAYSDDVGTHLDAKMSAPLNEDTPRILSEFSSMANPPIESVLKDKTLEVMLTDGEVGNRGAFDCFVGSVARGFSMFRTPGGFSRQPELDDQPSHREPHLRCPLPPQPACIAPPVDGVQSRGNWADHAYPGAR
jgi:hypothetical protein